MREWPDDPLSGELRQRLPASFKDLALHSLDEGRSVSAVRFYRAYRTLEFAPPDADLDRRFAGVSTARERARP